MNDMSQTIVAKSDQINAADLIGAPRIITIKEVRIKAGDDQPVTMLIEGDKKAFRPCKGVRRLLVRVWGPDANKYIGQSLEIFCDPSVTWAGKEEGGIRVSKMTGLNERIVEFMRTSRAATRPYEIHPLRVEAPRNEPSGDRAQAFTDSLIEQIKLAGDTEILDALLSKEGKALAKLQRDRPELAAEVDRVTAERREWLSGDDFGATGEA